MKEVETIRSPRRAATLLAHPLRARILYHARHPISGSDLARTLGQPRQRIGYHVRQLARDGFLVPVAQQKKRNMVEQQYVATSRAFVLIPEILGEVAPDPDATPDSASAAQLVALCARAQTEVASVIEAARDAGLRVRTFSLPSDIRFESVEQRIAFTEELIEALTELMERYSSERGRRFRFITGLYPAPELR